VEPAGILQVVEERVGRGGVGQCDEVSQERRLQGGTWQQHPGMPVELWLALQEHPVELRQWCGEAGESEVERPSPIATKSWVTDYLPGPRPRGRRAGRG